MTPIYMRARKPRSAVVDAPMLPALLVSSFPNQPPSRVLVLNAARGVPAKICLLGHHDPYLHPILGKVNHFAVILEEIRFLHAFACWSLFRSLAPCRHHKLLPSVFVPLYADEILQWRWLILRLCIL